MVGWRYLLNSYICYFGVLWRILKQKSDFYCSFTLRFQVESFKAIVGVGQFKASTRQGLSYCRTGAFQGI